MQSDSDRIRTQIKTLDEKYHEDQDKFNHYKANYQTTGGDVFQQQPDAKEAGMKVWDMLWALYNYNNQNYKQYVRASLQSLLSEAHICLELAARVLATREQANEFEKLLKATVEKEGKIFRSSGAKHQEAIEGWRGHVTEWREKFNLLSVLADRVKMKVTKNNDWTISLTPK